MDTGSTASQTSTSAHAALRRLADAAGMMAWMTDIDGVFIYLHPTVSSDKPEELNTAAWACFIHPDDRRRIAPIIEKAQTERQSYRVEYRIVKSDGAMRWVTNCAAPRFSASGEFLGYNGTIFDSHERLDLLVKSEERFRSLTALSSDWYWETDENDCFTFISDGIQRLWGMAPESCLGKTLRDLATDPGQPGLLAYFAKIAQREPFRYIRYAAAGNGAGVVYYASISGEPVFEHGVFKGYCGVMRDLTDEINVAEQLVQLAAENKALIDNSLDIMALVDDDGRVLRVNRAVRDIIGYQPEEIIGRKYLEFVAPDELERAKALARRLRTGKNTVHDIENGWVHKDGSIVHLSWSVRWSDDTRLTYATARDVTESRRTRAELRRSNHRLYSMLESIGDAFFAVDRDWRITYVNRKTADFVGRPREALIGKTVGEAMPEILASTVFPYYEKAMEARKRSFFEAYYEPARAWVEVRVYPYEEGISVFFHDITARREAEKAVRQTEWRFREVIEMTPAGYMLADEQARLVDVNPALCSLSGYAMEELIGQGITKLFPAYLSGTSLFTRGHAGSVHGMEVILRHKQGHLIYVLVNVNVHRDAENNATSLTAFVTDITERKQTEARLQQLATRDALTGLPNRAALNDHLQHMIDFARHDQPIGVLFIDLDRFKEVNDSMGHEPGDALLREVARRLQKNLRPNDVVARLGGDEFVVAAHCSKGRHSAVRIAEKLLSTLAAPVDIAGQEVFVGASIGISMFPQDGQTKELLFQNADTAMYRAKAAGRNGYCFFEAEMSVEAKTRMALEHSLRRALERDELELFYQPRLNLKSMTIVGMEALLRWNHPQLGLVSPMQFIPIAEERGLIEPIGRWVLKQACAQAQRLIDKFGRALRVSVNLSARQLKCQDLFEQVADALETARLAPELLELELTESALIEDMDVSADVLKELKKLGIQLSVDDFGTGYSGLAYLRRFPLDTLKLDRSFVTQQGDGGSDFKFIKAFVDLAHALNLSVVAEGVETAETLQFLREAACDEAQGFLFAKPLTVDQLDGFLARLPA